jgi:hypothetical protein
MAGRIFINYRRGDDPGFTQALLSRLERTFAPEQIFIDIDNIEPGLDFVQVLADQVAKCDVVLAVIGKGWIDARDETNERRLDNPEDFVRIEIESALKQNKRVIPVLVGDAPMPSSKDLPDDLKPLARRNAVRLTHERFRADADGLIKALERALEQAEVQRDAQEAAAQAQQERVREEAAASQKAEAQRLAAEASQLAAAQEAARLAQDVDAKRRAEEAKEQVRQAEEAEAAAKWRAAEELRLATEASQRAVAQEAARLAQDAQARRRAEEAKEQIRQAEEAEAAATQRAVEKQRIAHETQIRLETAAQERAETEQRALRKQPTMATGDAANVARVVTATPPVVAKASATKWASAGKIVVASIVALASVVSLVYFLSGRETLEEYSKRVALGISLTNLSCQVSRSQVGKHSSVAAMMVFGAASRNSYSAFSGVTRGGYNVVLNQTDPPQTNSSIQAILDVHPDIIVVCGSPDDREKFTSLAQQAGLTK